jgi:hypothetical protein
MKLSPLILCLLTSSSLLFSQEIPNDLATSLSKSVKKTDSEIYPSLNKGFFYLKSGASSGVLSSDPAILLGVGYRSKLFGSFIHKKLKNNFAFDVNFQSTEKKYYKYRAIEMYLPKLNGLYFFNPKGEKSLYLGTGFAITISDPAYIVAEKDALDQNIFKGQIFPSNDVFLGTSYTFILGYDLSLHKKYMNCFQIEWNMPMDSFQNDYDYSNHWTINLSYLLGF